jgi:hypothetical protein
VIRVPARGHNRGQELLSAGDVAGNLAGGFKPGLHVVDLGSIVRIVLEGLSMGRRTGLEMRIGRATRRTATNLRRLAGRIAVVRVECQQLSLDVQGLLMILGPNLRRFALPHGAGDDRWEGSVSETEKMAQRLTDLIVVQVGILGLDLVVLVLAIEDVGIGRARDLDLRRGDMLPFRVPNGNVADNGDVGAHDSLGSENPDLGIVGVPSIHHVLIEKLADANVN